MWHDYNTGQTRNGRALSFPSLGDDRGEGLLRRVASLQFITKKLEPIDKEVRAFVKLRYKDVAKYIIWPECRLEDGWRSKVDASTLPSAMVFHETLPRTVPSGPDPRTILNKAELEDHRSPYLPCTINSITRTHLMNGKKKEYP
ncbi:hypothetical protein ANCDUO_01134 [Ancylostoma duodenale]|uniref:Uncharacterized protein n=1 Tax=Ancylostoma duodenale TaxID=51022 RepID=A0A0C2DEY2_9BILA|nr:hypothetical protein ANCDUO_01134 [Ancylostoma duodenale]